MISFPATNMRPIKSIEFPQYVCPGPTDGTILDNSSAAVAPSRQRLWMSHWREMKKLRVYVSIQLAAIKTAALHIDWRMKEWRSMVSEDQTRRLNGLAADRPSECSRGARDDENKEIVITWVNNCSKILVQILSDQLPSILPFHSDSMTQCSGRYFPCTYSFGDRSQRQPLYDLLE